MHVWSDRIRFCRAAATVLAAAGAFLFARAAMAQAPTPTPGLPCPGMMNLVDGPIDASLHVSLVAKPGPTPSEVTLTWSMSGPSGCSWIQKKSEGSDPPYPSFAVLVLPPGPGSHTLNVAGSPGEHCWRVFAFSDGGRSEPSEACIHVQEPATPRSPQDSPPATGPSQLPLCPSAFNLDGFPIDLTLRPRLEAAWVEAQRALVLNWDTGPGANCAFFQVQDYAGGYSGVGEMAWADFITAPGASARLRPAVTTGRQCFRLFAISAQGRSEPVETCAEVPAGAVRTPNPPGIYPPPPSGTPWPPPAGAKLEGHFLLLDANNFPLPPSQQAWFAGVSWAMLPGFTGRFEIQRAQVRPGEPLLWSALPSGQIPVSLAAGDRISIEEWITTASTWCFRVRTIANSPTGTETGPFSPEVCQERPPSSGGNGQATVTPAPAPLPPDAGNSSSAPANSGWLVVAAATVAAALLAVGAAAWRRPR